METVNYIPSRAYLSTYCGVCFYKRYLLDHNPHDSNISYTVKSIAAELRKWPAANTPGSARKVMFCSSALCFYIYDRKPFPCVLHVFSAF